MRKFSRIILLAVFIVSILLGAFFVTTSNIPANEKYFSREAFDIDRFVEGGINFLDNKKDEDFTFDEEGIIDYEYKEFEDYFVDYKIPTKIEDTSITGDGTLNSPYQINSTEDFLFIMKKGTFEKYFDVNCDIVLNDETFDENGNPSGGDGVYYDIDCRESSNAFFFDGKGHTIYGLHMVNAAGYDNGSYISLFGYAGNKYIKKICNLNMENFYVSGNYSVTALAHRVEKIENCKLIKGTLCNSGNYTHGFASHVNEMKNCTSYATINGVQSTNGLGRQIINAEKCYNYGKINAEGFYASGLFEFSSVMRECANYGDIHGASSYIGGLVSKQTESITITNCYNYGNVVGDYLHVGGIFGLLNTPGVVTISNSGNFGLIKALSNSAHQYQLYGDNNRKEVTINLINCEFNSPEYAPLCHNGDVNMQNCRFTMNEVSGNSYLFYSLGKTMAKNITVNVNLKGGTFRLCRNYNGIESVVAKNIYVLINGEQNQTNYINLIHDQIKIDGAIFSDQYGTGKNYYYGSDFSDYAYAYKTGKVFIKQNSVLLAEKPVDTHLLEALGYTEIYA